MSIWHTLAVFGLLALPFVLIGVTVYVAVRLAMGRREARSEEQGPRLRWRAPKDE